LAQANRSVLVIERERFPRFHIGESLLPESNSIFRRLGIDRAMAEREFVVKRGATFETESGSRSCRIEFEGAPGVAEPRTYHVPRGEFDQMLLQRSEELGAEVRTECRVREVDLGSGRPRVSYLSSQGVERTAVAEVVLDATGRHGLLARQMSLRVPDPELRKVALFAHFRGISALEGPAAGDIRIITRPDGGWIWIIPLPRGRTSVGFVFDHSERVKEIAEAPGECIERWLRSVPALGNLEGAERVGRARWEGNFSYSTRAYAGDRWLLLGDAGSFLDPVFSTGVQFALEAGIEAADAVHHALRSGRTPVASDFKRYDRRQRQRYLFFRRLVCGFYRPAFRDVLFRPDRWPAGARAVAAVLAGCDRPDLLTRLRLRVFYLIVAWNERSSIVPPSDDGSAAPATPRGSQDQAV
jgi:flavin-dependent dehydrogenase